jgi:hypothetical protein
LGLVVEHLGANSKGLNLKIKGYLMALRLHDAKPYLLLGSSDNVDYVTLKAALF